MAKIDVFFTFGFQGYVKVGCPVTAAVGAGAAIGLTGGAAAPVAVPSAIALATTCGVVAATNQCDKIGRRKRSGEIEVRFNLMLF